MNKKKYALWVLAVCAGMFTVTAEVPAGYYDSATGKSGSALQNALSALIGDREMGYDNLWTVYRTTDRRADGKVWDMYSSTSDFDFGTDQCGNYSREGDCYNREHSVPKSWLGGRKYSDAHVVVPTDGYVNNRRSNMPFGEVSSTSYVSNGSFSKVGSCTVAGYSGQVFEPADEYKGDFARIYFYMATRYTTQCGSWSGEGASVFSGSFPYLAGWTRTMMLRWHREDPVSEKEINRNDAVYDLQGNRNPFVDYPELAELIFGDQTNVPFSPGETAYIEQPAANTTFNVGTVVLGTGQSSVSAPLTIVGHNIEGNLTAAVSGASAAYFSLSSATLTADAVNDGTSLTVTYTPAVSGSHTATLTLAGGGLQAAHTVQLSGSAREGFAALPATDVTDTSFVAHWSVHSQATDYELAVWREASGTAEQQTVLDADLYTDRGWETAGYTNYELKGLRLASGSTYGEVTTPALDLSLAPVQITVTCEPYRTSDNSRLYVSVDGSQVGVIDCADGSVTETVTLTGAATASSVVSFRAEPGARVYLQHVTITAGGGVSVEMLEGYPRRVGDVLQYEVKGLESDAEYHYMVTAYGASGVLDESNIVDVNTMTSAVHAVTLPAGMYVYASAGRIYVDGAPANAQMRYYTVDGSLCGVLTLHAQRQYVTPARKGIYIVQIITAQGSYAKRVVVY